MLWAYARAEALMEQGLLDQDWHNDRRPPVFTHANASRNTLGSGNAKKTLLYVYWEPANSNDIEEYHNHREEVAHFNAAASDSEINFVARSYRQLWDDWKESRSWSGMNAHLSNLERRYSFSI